MTKGLARYHVFLKAARRRFDLGFREAQALYRAFKSRLDRQPNKWDLKKPVAAELADKAPRQARAYQKAKAEGKPLKPAKKPAARKPVKPAVKPARKPVGVKKPRKRVKPRPRPGKPRRPKKVTFPKVPPPPLPPPEREEEILEEAEAEREPEERIFPDIRGTQQQEKSYPRRRKR